MRKQRNNQQRRLIIITMFLMFLLTYTVQAGPKISRKHVQIEVGKTVTLKVKGTGKSKVTWSSSNKKAATVTRKGVVKGIAPGTSTVRAKIGKKKLKCIVTVIGLQKSSKKGNNTKTDKSSKSSQAAQNQTNTEQAGSSPESENTGQTQAGASEADNSASGEAAEKDKAVKYWSQVNGDVIKEKYASPYDQVIEAALIINVNMEYGDTKDAYEAMTTKVGNCVSANMLLAELLTSMGFQAEVRYAADDDMSRYPMGIMFLEQHHNVRVIIEGNVYYTDATPNGLVVYMSSETEPVFYATAIWGSWEIVYDRIPGHTEVG